MRVTCDHHQALVDNVASGPASWMQGLSRPFCCIPPKTTLIFTYLPFAIQSKRL
jgi:hypothetical protein